MQRVKPPATLGTHAPSFGHVAPLGLGPEHARPLGFTGGLVVDPFAEHEPGV
jgi:hypothetical protein